MAQAPRDGRAEKESDTAIVATTVPTSPKHYSAHRPRAHIASVGTSVPAHAVGQEQAREFVRSLFRETPGLERLLGVFDHSGITNRYLAMPPEWYLTPHSFAEKNRAWQRVALELAEQASRRALEQAGTAAKDVAGLLFASTTGIATPSLDSYLIKRLDLPRDARRLPVWGLGCSGGVACLAHASSLATSWDAPLLVVAVELCSVTLILEDQSATNLVGTSLFGDGAAAAVVTPGGPGAEILGSFSRLFDDSEGVVAWEVVDQGLKLKLDRSAPETVNQQLRMALQQGLQEYGLDLDEVGHYALHPGGAKVLEAYRQALGICGRMLAPAAEVLAEYGNMSSPTALFVLRRILECSTASGKAGLLLAPGPGFSIEGVVFRW